MSDNPIVAMSREMLATEVATYKAMYSQWENQKEQKETHLSYAKALTMPLAEDEQDSLEGVSEFLDDLSSTFDSGAPDERKSAYFAHVAKALYAKADRMKELVEVYGWAIPPEVTLTPISREDLIEQYDKCLPYFTMIVALTNDPEEANQPLKDKKVRGGGKIQVLDLPKVNRKAAKESDTPKTTRSVESRQLLMYVDGELAHAKDENYEDVILDVFEMTPPKFVERCNEQGIKLAPTEEAQTFTFEGTSWELKFELS